ncbi:SDR family oxidoreductase [Paenibacillus physcomitrellae]|uniref:Oxidoreductase DltE n=1 Tax=Paenibacillus physcomitrellae TaxID=1619311 RepID=A0ABQ1FPU8_9BACL|nr:SDR family NAD(P)-dependent oxidoreductase [Paenibacillus physcomitrellae]GGA25555.1 putative oxidoreductase DltE [Paenibacillus physcomitrellae]
MKLDANTILITGGATGIGLAMAERFIEAGSSVIICGRRADRLEEAKAQNPQLHTYQFDVSEEEGRIKLFEQVTKDHPNVNVLINNAGVMRYLDLPVNEPWKDTAAEIATNVEAPIHLSMLFAEYFKGKDNAAIMNITSGLSHVPLAVTPIYSATKAAIYSFTLSLRKQLEKHGVQVIEICPPLTNTDLGVPGSNTAGVAVDEFIDALFKGFAEGKQQVTYGWSQLTTEATPAEREQIFNQLNG